jgi:hypothetical protein
MQQCGVQRDPPQPFGKPFVMPPSLPVQNPPPLHSSPGRHGFVPSDEGQHGAPLWRTSFGWSATHWVTMPPSGAKIATHSLPFEQFCETMSQAPVTMEHMASAPLSTA